VAKERKKKAPSRVRYEESHPTVSCRVSMEVYDRLEEVKYTEGLSFADILKIGLGITEPIAKHNALVNSRYRKAGYAEAERLYKVTFPCPGCGQVITVTGNEAKEAAGRFMNEHGWAHKECH